MARTTDKLKSFESNYEKLEDLVKQLESPDLTLKESLDLFEQAIKLSKQCEGALEYAKQRAQALADIAVSETMEEPQSKPKQKADVMPEEGTLDL